MEDEKWKISAEQWESAYRKAVARRDYLEGIVEQVCKASNRLARGCSCDYDYRCASCAAILRMHRLTSGITKCTF